MRNRIGTHWIILGLLCLLYFLTYIDRVNLSTAAPFISREFGLSNTDMGIVFSAFAYPYAVFQIFGGRLADRFGSHKVLFICTLITGVSTILVNFTTGVISLFLCRLLLGVGEGATFPAATRAMQDWVPAGHKGFAQGITHSFSRLGNSITPPLVAFLMVTFNWRMAFVLLGAVSLVWVVVWAVYFRDDPKKHKRITPEELAILPDRSKSVKRSKKAVPWRRLALRMSPVTATYFCYGWCLWLFLNWLPSFFSRGYGLDIKKTAIFAAGVFFSGVVGDTLGGVLSDVIFRRTKNVKAARLSVSIVSFLGAAVCLLASLLTKNINFVAIWLSAGFFFLELNIGPLWSVPMDIAPQYAGAASGMMNTGMAIAGIISPILFGKLVDGFGNWVYPFSISIGILVLGAVLSLAMHPDRPFVDEPEDAGTPNAASGQA